MRPFSNERTCVPVLWLHVIPEVKILLEDVAEVLLFAVRHFFDCTALKRLNRHELLAHRVGVLVVHSEVVVHWAHVVFIEDCLVVGLDDVELRVAHLLDDRAFKVLDGQLVFRQIDFVDLHFGGIEVDVETHVGVENLVHLIISRP